MKQLQDWEEWMKDKLDDQEIVFQESHWEAAQKMIDAAESQPKPPFVWWGRGLFAVLLVGALGISGYLLWGNQAFESNNKSVTWSKKAATFAEKQANTSKKENTKTTQVTIPQNEVNKGAVENKVAAIEKTTTSSSLKEGKSIDVNQRANKPLNKKEIMSNFSQNQNVENNRGAFDNSSKVAKTNVNFTPEKIVTTSIETKLQTLNVKIKNTAIQDNALIASRLESSNLSEPKEGVNKINVGFEKEIPKEIGNATANNTGMQDSKETSSKQAIINEKEPFIIDENAKLIQVLQGVQPISVETLPIQKGEFQNTAIPLPKKYAFNRFHADIFVGASLMQNPKNISPTAGLRLKYFIHKNIAVQLYGNYFTSNGFSIIKETQQIQYGLGFEEVTNRLTTTTLQYAEVGTGLLVPIKRHEIFAGIGYARLLKATGTLEKIERNSVNAKAMLVESQSVGAYQEGLQKSDVTISVGYGYYLTRNLQVRLSGVWGLKDITDNSFLGNSQIDKNKQIRLGLAWSFK